jgi:glucose/arabinose dehydrogenase
LVFGVASLAAAAAAAADAARTGSAAFGDWRSDAPGVRRLITPADLPPPFATLSAANPSRRAIRPPSALPKAPPGFVVDLFAEGLAGPRILRVAPDGDVFVAESGAGIVRVFRYDEANLPPTQPSVFAAGLSYPFGLAFYPSGPDPHWLYVATTGAVLRFPYSNGDRRGSSAPQVVAKLPAGGAHWLRDVAFSSDGKTMFVSVGSASNDANGMARLDEAAIASLPLGASWSEEHGRANVLAFDPEGGHGRVYATGLRNCSGLAVQSRGGAVWCAVNERDGLGDDLPPDFATRVAEGAFYGWPWFYIGGREDPRHKGERPELAVRVTTPDVLIQPHSAPLGIAFYEGEQFPAEYRGDAFVALHGSWNRAKRTGYKVVRILMKDGAPTGAYEDFLTGFVADDTSVWGRPVGVAVAKDGALLVSDDEGGTIWRARWGGR